MIKGLARRLVMATIVWGGLHGSAVAAVPGVVVSISPIHSLVAAVMEGRGTPKLLLPGGASPHATALKPSDATALQGAQVVFWIGPDLETFLEKPLQALAANARVVALWQADGVVLLPYRQGGAWTAHDHEAHDHREQDDHGPAHGTAAHDDKHDDDGAWDMHLWLDPRNGIAIANAVAASLAAADPEGAELYRSNAGALEQRLRALDLSLQQTLSPLSERPYIVFHDAYQYLEARYGLNAVGSITLSPEHQPSARQVAAIRQTIRERGAACVFSEPQFPPKLVATVTEGTGARSGVLDPLGAALTPGPGAYPALMQGLAAALDACLTPRSPG